MPWHIVHSTAPPYLAETIRLYVEVYRHASISGVLRYIDVNILVWSSPQHLDQHSAVAGSVILVNYNYNYN